jgi:hypothetical protein
MGGHRTADAASHTHHLGSPAVTALEGVARSELETVRKLWFTPGGDDDCCTMKYGELGRGSPNPGASSMNQHDIARLQLAHKVQ